MSKKIGLISDIHACPQPLEQALQLFEQQQVDQILCAGDIAGYFDKLSPTITLLQRYNCQCVLGNHDIDFIEAHPELEGSADYEYLINLPYARQFDIENCLLYLVHSHPPDFVHGGIKLLNQDGNIIPEQKTCWQKELKVIEEDILIVGHTHQVFAEQLGHVFVINPGSTQFNHSCMILTLPEKRVEYFALQGKEILRSWNFSMLFKGDEDYPAEKV